MLKILPTETDATGNPTKAKVDVGLRNGCCWRNISSYLKALLYRDSFTKLHNVSAGDRETLLNN